MGGVTLTSMPEPFPVPIGLRLNQTARAVGRAFDKALADAGGSLPVWLILLNLTIGRPGTQRDLAEAVGIREATLTHHLNAMDADGLITRTRDAANRRVQVVTLTDKGERAFLALRAAAVAFDARLRAGLDDTDLATLATLLAHLSANVAAPGEPAPPWAGLSDSQSPRRPRSPTTL
jgi:MarR family transcriptional regulator, transcriptional regulator for hemolysin